MLDLPFPGTLTLTDGDWNDYKSLRRFHYRTGDPRTWCRIVAARYAWPGRSEPRPIAVGVLSWPFAVSRGRRRAFAMDGWSYGEQLRFANANIRTISRVIVHPTFRAIGLSTQVIRRLILLCPTRYVEATAKMGRAHPLFERAGMLRVEPERDDEALYYLIDRHPDLAPPSRPAAEGRGSIDLDTSGAARPGV